MCLEELIKCLLPKNENIRHFKVKKLYLMTLSFGGRQASVIKLVSRIVQIFCFFENCENPQGHERLGSLQRPQLLACVFLFCSKQVGSDQGAEARS